MRYETSDLRRTVRYKKRRKPTQASAKDCFYRQGHNYEDFQNYIKEHPDINVVEMDCVEGKKGESKAILTFTFRNCNLMLMFLLEYQDQECVLEVFVWLETVLEQEAFKKLFPVILTDGGSEFSAEKRWRNSVTEVKVQLFFTVILTVSGKKEPVKRIMSIYVTSVPKAAHSLT